MKICPREPNTGVLERPTAYLGVVVAAVWTVVSRRRYCSEWTQLIPLSCLLSLLTSCGASAPNPQSSNGWTTNCSGPEFSRFSKDSQSGPGPARQVFKINDQLVLAVPKENWPSAATDAPAVQCRKLADVPRAHFLYFVIQGHWSSGYRAEDIPVVSNRNEFVPDLLTVRVELPNQHPFSAEEERQLDQIRRSSHEEESNGTRELGGLTCYIPKRGMGRYSCSTSKTWTTEPDQTLLQVVSYDRTPFELVAADVDSTRYGGIHVYWQGWILDPAHTLEIDDAIFRALAEWNLVGDSADRALSN